MKIGKEDLLVNSRKGVLISTVKVKIWQIFIIYKGNWFGCLSGKTTLEILTYRPILEQTDQPAVKNFTALTKIFGTFSRYCRENFGGLLENFQKFQCCSQLF